MGTRLKNKLAMCHDQVRDAYRNGATLRQIGDVHGVSAGTVRNVLVELGETMRARGRRKKAETEDPRILPIDASSDESVEVAATPPAYEGGSF